MKTKIEWCDYTVNPIKGLCPVGCEYCYARRMYKRFDWNQDIVYRPEVFRSLINVHKGDKVFVGSTMELFGEWVNPDWLKEVFDNCRSMPWLNFIFLTKRPGNLAEWSPFPPNCWVGVSATNGMMAAAGCAWLSHIEASVKFLSIEPLLSWNNQNAKNSLIGLKLPGISWVLIGQQTPVSLKTMPKVDWVANIVETADEAKIPVFLKNNLAPLLAGIQ